MSSVEVASIDDYFPDVILGKILRHCPSNCYKTLRTVSKRWSQVVDRFVGRLLVVKCGNKYVLDLESTLDKLSIKGNFWVTLSPNMDEDLEQSTLEESNKQLDAGDASSVIPQKSSCCSSGTPLPVIPNADQVRKIGFVGDIDYKSLEYFLGECKNVTSVYLHLSAFAKRTEEERMSNVTPFLEELVIDSAGIQGSKLFSYRTAFGSLASFLEDSQFPRLKKFIFRIPFFEKREGRISRAVSFFLGKHSSTLKSFSLHQKYDVCEEDSDSSEDKDGEGDVDKENTKERSRRSRSHSSSKSSNAEDDSNFLSLAELGKSAMELKKVQLEEVHVVLCHKQESDPLWKNMLLHQDSLRKCIFAGSKIPCPVKSIEANGQTLVTLRLDIRDSVDLECFRNCSNLKYLSLGGLKECEYEDEDGEKDDLEDISFLEQFGHPLQLRNGHSLPPSLESVEIMNLRTHKDDLRFICIELPNVRDLILKNLGWEGDLGLRLMDLAHLWNLRKLDHFLIKASLNMTSYSELEEKEDSLPEVNLLACLIQSNSFAASNRFFLDVWKIGSSGMYTTDKSKLGCLGVTQSQTLMMETETTDVFEIPSCVVLNEDEEEEESEEESESSADEEEEESQEEDADDASEEYESVRDSLDVEEEGDASTEAKTS